MKPLFRIGAAVVVTFLLPVLLLAAISLMFATPAEPEWRPVYDALTANGETAAAERLLQSAIDAFDLEAQTFCAEHTDNSICSNTALHNTSGFPNRAADYKKLLRALSQVPFWMRTDDLEQEFFDMRMRFDEHRPGGLKFAVADLWHFERCVVPLMMASDLSIAVVRARREIKGAALPPSTFERALKSCEVKIAAFASAVREGSYGQSAIKFADEWDDYAESFIGPTDWPVSVESATVRSLSNDSGKGASQATWPQWRAISIP